MNNMNRKAALCGQLNMNFEEANELFEEESLGSLQMAKVNGGAYYAREASAIAQWITALPDVYSCRYEIMCSSTEDPNSAGENIKVLQDEVKEIARLGHNGIIVCESIVGGKVYGVKFYVTVTTPSPAPIE